MKKENLNKAVQLAANIDRLDTQIKQYDWDAIKADNGEVIPFSYDATIMQFPYSKDLQKAIRKEAGVYMEAQQQKLKDLGVSL